MTLVKYIVLHELVHLRERKHNLNFWVLVSNYFRTPKELEKQLEKYWFFTEKIIRKILLTPNTPTKTQREIENVRGEKICGKR